MITYISKSRLNQFILWDADKKLVVSEAHGVCSKKLVEIATVTHENYRGQKLATISCNHLIHYVVSKGMQPVWECDETSSLTKNCGTSGDE